ncbi:hypothetical protein BVRB_6g129390 [Beta vulgaris subsp. vulgaris]|uniref:putative disease resistance protein RGA3 n=1 Tax=Beta vulgaris subsp. vulgaris TaxID=3555 RepID=UPI00053F9EEA|nr:putative disease resistance protein RGA3 [Beta vulgaris subsp. vulgaris]KMT09467.1 hypothetical protein BVRB_6g129390 [Beta vulgaris subsp. vulgaris]
MAETIILPLAKSILEKLVTFPLDLALNDVTERIKLAKSVKKDVKTIHGNLSAICAVLKDAEAKQYASHAIKVWLTDLKSVVYELDDLLDEVAYDALRRSVNKGHFLPQLRYYLSPSSNPLVTRFHLSQNIKDLREKLASVVAKKNDFGLTVNPVEIPIVERDLFNDCSYVNESVIVGRDEAKKELITRLLAHGTAVTCPCVLPVVGMGGIGKTTLAKLVYKDLSHLTGDQFDMKLWACVSHKFNLSKLLENIINQASNDVTSNLTLEQLVRKLQNLLNGKKYFLVLDDVWLDDASDWTDLKSIFEGGKVGSAILVTTRSAQVASITQTIKPYDLDRLPDDVCWSIFEQLAFMEDEKNKYPNLYEIGRSIVEKCAGVPLVVKSIGSLLRRVRDEGEWQRINNADSVANLHGESNKVLQLLRISYDKLPSHLKPCFVYCALKAKDVELYPTQLIYLWNAHGLLKLQDGAGEIEACGYANAMNLVSRSLLEQPKFEFNETIFACNIHDLLHDVAVDILGNELAFVTCDELHVSESTRHIIWGYEAPDSIWDKEFPKDLLNAKKARTFKFGYRMNHVSRSFLEGVISNFSCLRILEIGDSQFEELPRSIGNLKHLRGLKLSYNPLLKSLPDTICNLLNLQTLDLYSCEQLKELPKKIYRLLNVRYFVITTCQTSLVGTKFNRLRSLRFLWIYNCKGLVSLWDDGDVGNLTSIRRLYIQNCPLLTRLPNNLKSLALLEDLVISNCEALDLEENQCLSGFQKLQSLAIIEVPQLRRLPDGIQSTATSLRYLCISGCDNLSQLPDGLKQFVMLRKILINNCPKLMALPEGFPNLDAHQELSIRNCPQLSG